MSIICTCTNCSYPGHTHCNCLGKGKATRDCEKCTYIADMMGMSIPNGTGVRNYSASSSSSSTPSPSVWVPKTQYVPDPDLKKYQNTSSSQSSSSTTLLVNGTINGNRINLQFTAQPASQSTISYVPSQPTVTVPTPAETAIMRGSLYQQFSGGNLSNYFTPYTPPYTHLHVMSSQDSSANYAFPPTGPC